MQVEYIPYFPRIGCHLSKENTLTKTFERMNNIELNCFQIYLGNGRGYSYPKCDIEDFKKARKIFNKNNQSLVIHGCLLYNLCGSVNGKSDPKYSINLSKSIEGLKVELDIASLFNAGVVLHIGSCKDKNFGIDNIIHYINELIISPSVYSLILSKHFGDWVIGNRKLILENCAGEGNKIGKNIEEIAYIMNNLKQNIKRHISICWDTAHSFGAGEYHFGKIEEIDRFYKEFDEKIGLEYLSVIHLNDSRVEFGSKKDRHYYLCEGYQFNIESLRYFIKKFGNKIMICETPSQKFNGENGYGGFEDISLIRGIL